MHSLSQWLRQQAVIHLIYSWRYPNAQIFSYLPRPLVSSDVIIERNVRFGNQLQAIGDFTWIGEETTFHNCERIGKLCSIGRHCEVGLINHPLDWFSTSGWVYRPSRGIIKTELSPTTAAPTKVGNDVLLSEGVAVIEGVHLADGCVVGARSVVTRDTEPYGIYAGTPAKLLRFRFGPPIRQAMQRIDWSKIERQVLLDLADVLNCPERFVERLSDLNLLQR